MNRHRQSECDTCPLNSICGVAEDSWSSPAKRQVCGTVHADMYNTLAPAVLGVAPEMNWRDVRPGHTTSALVALAEIALRRQLDVEYPGSALVSQAGPALRTIGE